MPAYFASQILLNSNTLERLRTPREGETELEAKLSIFEEHRPKSPLHMYHLRPGKILKGMQMSSSHRYSVTVTLQDVNLNDFYLCGYLTIEGLTDEYPSLTTFFDGEVIGKKYPFQTRKWVDICFVGLFSNFCRMQLQRLILSIG